ncbi:MAG: exodeoxyribonuclease V subunit gamma [Idiomarina sp.]|nr:exodeoxyribonuclease V subunit gamma [Idiomarina sp.]
MQQDLVSGLVVAHSHRLEDLTEVAVTLMSKYPLPPLEEEMALVQSNGIAQWLKINVAQSSGIAAMINVTLPARFVWKAYRAVLGDEIPRVSPFDKDRLAWRIMRLLPDLVASDGEGTFRALANYLKQNQNPDLADQRKLFQLSHRIADLFDQYQNYRADWLDHWTRGNDCLDHDGMPVPASDLWQPQLWRTLVNDIGAEQLWTNRAELHRTFVNKAKSLTQRPAGMPARVVVFGISSLPQQSLEVLDAIKGFTQVVLCVHNPCQHYWANIVDGKEALKDILKHTRRRHALKTDMAEDIQDDELHHHAQPLLASWGKQGRDYIHLLDLYDETLEKQAQFDAIKFELFDEQPAENLLQQLQNDVLNLRPLKETQAHWPAVSPHDSSIRFHSCHSVQREVEVLHDQLLQAFADDPTLCPRDIMVMVPDVNTYAPHVEAVFGRFERFQAGKPEQRRIPYTIADQGQRHQQPLLVALELLLTLEQSRVTQADVLALLAVPAVQERFALTAQELVEIQAWFDAAGARWGLDGAHRHQFGMPDKDSTNSWWFALERMVFGYMMGRPEGLEQDRWRSIEPYHEVAGLAASAAGKLANVIEALNQWWHETQQERALKDWALAAEQLLDTFFAPIADEDILLLAQLRGELSTLLEQAAESDFVTALEIAIFREAWLSRVDQPQLHQRFLAGAVNVATLMPMRAIPFRQIYVLGMNDDAYPRRQPNSDFDLMTERYRPGDRARREDDRYLFLEAMLSARDRFSVSWLGHSAQDNSEWPASVLMAQLREHLAQGWRLSGTEVLVSPTTPVLDPEKSPLLQHLTTEHKLQAFSPAYFQMQQPGELFTYASEWLEARQPIATQVSDDIPMWQQSAGERLHLSARDLDKFLREAAQPFFNQRLNTYFSSDDMQTRDSETFALDGLTSWQLRDELTRDGVRTIRRQLEQGATNQERLIQQVEQHLNRMQREGKLGVGAIATQMRLELFERVEAVLQAVQSALADFPTPAPDCPIFEQSTREVGGWLIEDHASQLFQNDQGELLQVIVSASAPKAKYYFYPYVKHLLLTLALQRLGKRSGSSARVTTDMIFYKKGNKGDHGAETVRFPALDANQARVLLNQLMARYEETLHAPSPVVGELAVLWLETYYQGISGTLKEGRSKLGTISEEEARERATLAVDSALEPADRDPRSSWPYALRVGLDEGLSQLPDFKQAILDCYAPMVRLVNGQTPTFEWPEAQDAQKAESAEGARS